MKIEIERWVYFAFLWLTLFTAYFRLFRSSITIKERKTCICKACILQGQKYEWTKLHLLPSDLLCDLSEVLALQGRKQMKREKIKHHKREKEKKWQKSKKGKGKPQAAMETNAKEPSWPGIGHRQAPPPRAGENHPHQQRFRRHMRSHHGQR